MNEREDQSASASFRRESAGQTLWSTVPADDSSKALVEKDCPSTDWEPAPSIPSRVAPAPRAEANSLPRSDPATQHPGDRATTDGSTLEETRDIPPVLDKHGETTRAVSPKSPGARQVGPYYLEERLGKGMQGEVWRAIRLEPFVRIVALKILSPEYALDDDRVDRFRKEAARGGKPLSPTILPILDYGEANGRPYIAMPLVQGMPLSDMLKQRREHREGKPLATDIHPLAILDEQKYDREAAKLMAGIARGLADAHAARIIHRDIKPSNILLDRIHSERAYLADFGLARDLDDVSQSLPGFEPGTPIYMSPERLLGATERDEKKGDIFSFGVTLYETFTLRRALSVPLDMPRGQWPIYLAELTPARPRKHNPRLNRDLEAVILKAMNRSPRARYDSANDLADDLERFARGEPVKARPPGPSREILGKIKRHTRVLWGLTIVLAMAGVYGAISSSRERAAANSRTLARAQLEEGRIVDATQTAIQAQALSPDHPEMIELTRELTTAVFEEVLDSADSTNVEDARRWFLLWVELRSQNGTRDIDAARRQFATDLDLAEIAVVSDVPGTWVTFHPLRSNGRPKQGRPLYACRAGASGLPERLPEVVRGSYWVTAYVPDSGAFVEGPWEVPASRTPSLSVRPKTTEDAAVGMVRLPGGVYQIGSDEYPGAPDHPRHSVKLEDYYLAPTEVTNREYHKYLIESGMQAIGAKIWPGTGEPPADRLDWPVVNVAFDQACAYAAWRGLRLVSEEELEVAARGATNRIRPEGVPEGWKPAGKDWTELHAVRSVPLDRATIAGSEPIFGLFGNACEFTLFRFRPYGFRNPYGDQLWKRTVGPYYSGPPSRNVKGWTGQVVRSGILKESGAGVIAPLGYTRRASMPAGEVHPLIGFRAARSVRPRFPTNLVSPPDSRGLEGRR